MAKFTPMDLIKSMSGKICGHSDISFAKRGDTQYTMKRCNPRTTPPSEAELQRQAKFKSAIDAVEKLSQEQITEYQEQFKKQKKNGKYATLRGFMIAMEYRKLG